MSYENAPATRMLATHCCVCSRPLVDAKSVEYGIGPECRKRHGHSKQEAAPAWAAVAMLLGSLTETPVDTAIAAVAAEDAHKLCNILTHAAATTKNNADLRVLASAIFAAGFRNLGSKIAKRRLRERQLAVEVSVEGERIHLKAPFNADANAAYKRIGGRWNPEAKAWHFPQNAKADLWDAIRTFFKGHFMLTPKTEAVI